jgi:hypothetical protein
MAIHQAANEANWNAVFNLLVSKGGEVVKDNHRHGRELDAKEVSG